jgi:hypothetical protein
LPSVDAGSAAAAGRAGAMNACNACRNTGHAGSPSRSTWFALSSSTKRAPGIVAARWRPSSNGTAMSSRACMTSVGTRICAAVSVTSTWWNVSSVRAAPSALAVSRCRSVHQRCCSSVPPGMKRFVNTWRKAAFSLPQPTRIMLTRVSASSRWTGVGSRFSAPRA